MVVLASNKIRATSSSLLTVEEHQIAKKCSDSPAPGSGGASDCNNAQTALHQAVADRSTNSIASGSEEGGSWGAGRSCFIKVA
jgi:hypothetical protein